MGLQGALVKQHNTLKWCLKSNLPSGILYRASLCKTGTCSKRKSGLAGRKIFLGFQYIAK